MLNLIYQMVIQNYCIVVELLLPDYYCIFL